MPTLLLCLVVVGVIFLASYLAYLSGKNRRISPEAKAHVDKELNKIRIMETIYEEEKASEDEGSVVTGLVPKIRILEELDVSPQQLKSCIEQLKKEQLVVEDSDSIILTTFGVQYCEVFIKKVVQEGEEE